MTDLQSDLDEFVEDGIATVDELMPPGAIDSLEQANRLLRRLRRLEREQGRLNETAEREVERINAWLADRSAGVTRDRERLTAVLEGWTRAWHSETGAKTVFLPNGELKLRAGRPKIEVSEIDSPELLTAAGHVEFVRHKFEVDRAQIAKTCKPGPMIDDESGAQSVVTPDGVELPGVVFWVPTEPVFSVKLAEDEPTETF